MKAQSVSVLDEATRQESILNWVLFKNEQDARMFAPRTHENDWYPGDAMYERPRVYYDWVSGGIYYNGNCVRHMIEEFEDGNMYMLTPDDRGYYHRYCYSCDVFWVGYQACWICEDPKTELEEPQFKKLSGNFDDFDIDFNQYLYRMEAQMPLPAWSDLIVAMDPAESPTQNEPIVFYGHSLGFRRIVMDEWVSNSLPDRVIYNGIEIPRDYNTESEIPLPDPVFHHDWSVIQDRYYMTSTQPWERRLR